VIAKQNWRGWNVFSSQGSVAAERDEKRGHSGLFRADTSDGPKRREAV
jgi:hypothetical protein